MSGGGYRADVSPQDAWSRLRAEGGAALVDVRTAAEWAYVGVPDLATAGAPLLKVEWQTFPAMQVADDFVATLDAALRAAGRGPDAPLFFICRSGARSASAAAAMTAAGYRNCHNVSEGFEGGRDADGHRGTLQGWKAAGLPWSQS